MSDIFDLAVIGGGIAGLVAAREAAVTGTRVAHVLGSDVMGGLVANVGALDDFSAGPVAGIDLAATLLSEASDLGAVPLMENAAGLVRRDGVHHITVGEETVRAKVVILANGARLRTLDVPGAARLAGAGVSQCGWCDGPLYRARTVAVVGGGDAAAQEALHLTEHAARVVMLVRGARLRARDDYLHQIAANPRIEVRLETAVVAVNGEEAVSGVRVSTGGIESVVPAAGVFVFIGLAPATEWLPAELRRDAGGALVTNERLETAMPGVLAVGAVRSGYSGALDDAIDEARRAVDWLIRKPA